MHRSLEWIALAWAGATLPGVDSERAHPRLAVGLGACDRVINPSAAPKG